MAWGDEGGKRSLNPIRPPPTKPFRPRTQRPNPKIPRQPLPPPIGFLMAKLFVGFGQNSITHIPSRIGLDLSMLSEYRSDGTWVAKICPVESVLRKGFPVYLIRGTRFGQREVGEIAVRGNKRGQTSTPSSVDIPPRLLRLGWPW